MSPLLKCSPLLLFTWTVLACFRSIVNLNLDTQFPVEFKYPNNVGRDSPHFGHSVLILNSSNSNQINFLVGAPNENVPLPHTGSIYQCQWIPQSDQTMCSRVNVQYDNSNRPTQDMHLGFNLLAQPNSQQQYVSCAFARIVEQDSYVNERNERWYHPNGACYQFKFGQARPLSTILPLNNSDEQFRFLDERKSNTIYYYSHGMSGFSSAFSQNGSRLLLGAPGFNNWKGALMEIISNSYTTNYKQYRIHNSSFSAPLRDIYMGYSVAVGRFFQSDHPTSNRTEYAVLGAPRIDLIGSVAFFRLGTVDQTPTIEEFRRLNGTQSGEYFGSSLLVLDINRDGYDDLLVGAPMYSTFRKGYSDEGRVFVYVSNGKNMIKQNILYGLTKLDARFGTSMASLGDINHDNYNDVVIGAPYEDGGKGAIYIYRGHREGIASNYSQRVSASELSSLRLFGFGYSFSAQVDVDRNQFNDLLVGSYLSNSAVLLRTRPITSLEAYMTITGDDYVDVNRSCSLLSANESKLLQYTRPPACVGLKFCFNTQNFDKSYETSLHATLLIDSLAKLSNERCFVIDNGQMTNVVRNTIVVRKQARPICSRQYVVLMKELSQIENYLDPLVFTLSFDFAHIHLDRTNIFQVPIVEGTMTNLTTETYLKMCSSTAKDCLSNISLKPSVLLDEEEVDVSEEIELIEGFHHKVKLQIYTINYGEAAFDGKLNITLNSTLSLISMDRRCQMSNIELPSNVNSTNIECTLESPLYGDSLVEIVFNPFETFKPVHIKMEASVANKLHPESLLQGDVIFRKVKRAAIDLNVTKSHPLIRYRSDFSNVSFESLVQIERMNYSTIDLLELTFIYPSTYNNHMLASPFVITNLNNRIPSKCEPEKNFNFVDYNESNLGQFNIMNNSESTTKSLNLTCSTLQIICKAVKCRIGPMSWQSISSYIKFSSKLWVGLINDKFGHYMYDQIAFNVRVVAAIVDDHIASVSGSNSTVIKNIEFIFKPVEPILDEPVPKWAFFVGAIIGLLILILLIWALSKCGFFKKSSALTEKNEDEEAEDNDESSMIEKQG